MGNANSGRRPMPTALKVLRGNPGQRKLNASEPKPPVGAVVKPAELSVVAGVVWERIAPVAIAMGTLTPADLEAFKTLCRLQARLDAIDVAEQPDTKAEKELAATVRPYYALFGLDPVGRAKITLPKADAPKSKWDGLIT